MPKSGMSKSPASHLRHIASSSSSATSSALLSPPSSRAWQLKQFCGQGKQCPLSLSILYRCGHLVTHFEVSTVSRNPSPQVKHWLASGPKQVAHGRWQRWQKRSTVS